MPSPPGPVADRSRSQTPGRFHGACLLARPCNRDSPFGARASCPRSRRQARMASPAVEPMRLAAHHEGKMPSPPGPVAGRSRSQTPGRSCGACLLARPCNRDGPSGARASCPRSRRQARMASPSVFEPMRLAAHSEGKMPSPPGPVADRRRSQTPGRFYGACFLTRPCNRDDSFGGEGILPSLAPQGAHGLTIRLRTNAPGGASRGQDALAPRGPSPLQGR